MKWVERMITVGVLVGAVAYLPRSLALSGDLDDLERVQSEQAELIEKNTQLAEEVASLRLEVEGLRGSRGEIERVAREDLRLVRSDETVIELIGDSEEVEVRP